MSRKRSIESKNFNLTLSDFNSPSDNYEPIKIISKKKKSDTISIELNTKKDTDANIEDKYTITKVGFFTSMLHKIEIKLIEIKKMYNIKQVLIPIVLILLFIILLIFFNFKGINKKTVNLK